MTNKNIKIIKCTDSTHFHNHRNPLEWKDSYDFNHHWYVKETKKSIIYRCKHCMWNEKKKKEFNLKFLPDEFIIELLTRNSSFKPDEIPKELIEAKRAQILLKRAVKKPAVICGIHGDLYLGSDQVIKKGTQNGIQLYRCKQCMKDMHKAHYIKNKEAILMKQKKYKDENKEKIREIKAKSYKKNLTPEVRKKQNECRRRYEKENPEKFLEKKRRQRKRHVDNLTDKYVTDAIIRGSGLSKEDIPQSLIEFKRSVMQLRRATKDKAGEKRLTKVLEKLDDLKNQKY